MKIPVVSTPSTAFFLVPSFYGFVSWNITFFLYLISLVSWDESKPWVIGVFFLVSAAFLVSFLLNLERYQTLAGSKFGDRLRNSGWVTEIVIVFHIFGFVGIYSYTLATGTTLGGGLSAFVDAFVNASYLIRAAEAQTFGTQFSYLGWVAIGLTIICWKQLKARPWLFAIAVCQGLANMAYVDRTRPIWILFTSILLFGLMAPTKRFALKFVTRLVVGALLGLLFFSVVATWIGKTGEGVEIYGDTAIDGPGRILYMYLTTGFPYFNALTDNLNEFTYSLNRNLYPLVKLGAVLGISDEPPGQVLDYFFVPFPTNVGTFLEPFYSDGGMIFVAIGILLYSFGLDSLGYKLLKSPSAFGYFAWANVCFTSFICFFSPKHASFPFWVFMIIGLLGVFFANLAYVRLPWRSIDRIT